MTSTFHTSSRTIRTCSAFAGNRKIASGPILDVALKVKEDLGKNSDATILVFDDLTSQPVELDLRGSASAIARRYENKESPEIENGTEKKSGPGRPKLGVVAREVTLLPRHWEWLATQPGGASVTLRKLVEEAKAKNHRKDELRRSQDATYKFMSAMTGNLPGYEEALRAFYANKPEAFTKIIQTWPKDLREHILKLSAPVIATK